MHIRKQALGIKTFESGVKIVGSSDGNGNGSGSGMAMAANKPKKAKRPQGPKQKPGKN